MAVDYCALLEQAQQAYNDYLTGKAVVEFQDQNGERVRYNAVNVNLLVSRIRELDALCNPTVVRPRKPIGFLF